ncbi:protein disulfide-isomerase A6 homolog [Drosophila hydei]|uniref:protein disulfide-isomerase n=1 Tax=Drosophila hydei TaxID=7224 RepID=A0A6J1LGV4_DROHY|nr:protein disulfide-isomerase A6 homolog [Drosophila hydei]
MNKLSKLWSVRVLAVLALCSIFMVFMLVAGQSSGLYSPSDGVVELTSSDFESTVLQDDAIWVVQFYAAWCSHCRAMVPEYQKLAKALNGVVKLGAVNGERNAELSTTYEVRGFPVIKIFGADKKKPINYIGPRTAHAIAESALSVVKNQIKNVIGRVENVETPEEESICFDSDVIELQAEDFKKQVLKSDDIWLVAFYTPWCPHCKNLAPEWIKVAKELKTKCKVGAVDASAFSELAAEYKVVGYPTIFYIPTKTEHAADAKEYKGAERTAKAIVDWANSQQQALGLPSQIVEIVSKEKLYNACINADWCMLAFLPPLTECNAECRNNLLIELHSVAAKYKKQRWGWVWSEAARQLPLENGLRVNHKYPALAVVNCNRMKMGLFRGAFSRKALDDYLAIIAKGRGKLTAVDCDDIPQIASHSAWDGQDAKENDTASERLLADEL